MAENPPALVVAAAAVDGAPLVGDAGVGAPPPPAIAEDPIHGVFVRTCGAAAQASRLTFNNIEGIDSLAAFTIMIGDTDVTEIAKRMASRRTAAGRVILGKMQIKRIQALVH